jgi:hypothetical protein
VNALVAIGLLLAASPVSPGVARNPLGQSFGPAQASRSPSTIHPAVVRVVAPGKGSVSFGSGTLVYADGETGLVITNWHVINEAIDTVSVLFPDGFVSRATIAKVDRDWDLAALAIRRPPGVEPVRLAGQPPRPGEMLTIAGYGSGTYRAVSGPCTQYVAPGVKFPYEMVELAASARQGDSGGPILNSQGELAGVLFGEGRGRTSGSYCGRVQWFLSAVVPSAATFAPQTAIAIASRPPIPVPAPASQGSPRRTPLPPQHAYVQQFSSPAPSPAVTIGAPPTSNQSVSRQQNDSQTIGWQAIAGRGTADQIKTVLAGIGALALVLHTLRWLGSS